MRILQDMLSVARKEIQVIVRDRGMLAVVFLLPLLMGSLFGGITLQLAGGEQPDILVRVGLVNQDVGGFGGQLAKALGEIDELEITSYDVVADAEDVVAKGEATAAIVIPAGFSRDIDAYTPVTIEVIVDPAGPEAASIVTGIMNQAAAEVIIWGEIQYGIRTILNESGLLADADEATRRAIEAQNLGVIMTRLGELRRDPPIAVVSESLAGVESEDWVKDFMAYLFPGFTVMFVFFTVSASASSLHQERDVGTLRRVLASPLGRGPFVGGKMLAYMLLVCLQVVVLFAVASILFHMPLGRSPLGLVLLTLSVALVAAAMGALVAGLTKSAKQADDLGTVLGFVLAGIGGALPLADAPMTRAGGIMATVSRLTPHAHAVEGYYKLMAEEATMAQVLPEIGILLLMGLVFFGIASRRLKLT